MSRYQICINDDRNVYVWKETWKEDTVADFLTRLSNSTNPQLDRGTIHLSFDGVRLGESTTMREVSCLTPLVLYTYHSRFCPLTQNHRRLVWKMEMS